MNILEKSFANTYLLLLLFAKNSTHYRGFIVKTSLALKVSSVVLCVGLAVKYLVSFTIKLGVSEKSVGCMK